MKFSIIISISVFSLFINSTEGQDSLQLPSKYTGDTTKTSLATKESSVADQNPLTFIDLLDKHASIIGMLFTLISVITGALLTPIAINWIDSRKRKKVVKYDLISAIYIFYNLLKIQYNGHSNHRFQTKNYLQSIKEGQMEFLQTIKEQLDHFTEVVNDNTYKLNEVEAKLNTLLVEIGDLYGYKEYELLHPKIMDTLLYSNNIVSNIYNPYEDTNTLKDLHNMESDIFEEIVKKGLYYQKLSDHLIKEVNIILPKRNS